MARRRMIDPNFWQSEDVAKLNVRQRLMLIGLFSNADDEGKLRGNPALIRSTVFPYEDYSLKEITNDLESIADIGSIILYEVEGNKYIKVANWTKFQRVDKPQPSMIPEPTKEKDNNHSENDSKNESKNDSTQIEEVENNDSCLKEKKGKEEKRKYADFVSLTEIEHLKLLDLYKTEERLKTALSILNNYKASRGKNYKSDYHVMIGWVKDEMDKKYPLIQYQEDPVLEPPDILNTEWY